MNVSFFTSAQNHILILFFLTTGILMIVSLVLLFIYLRKRIIIPLRAIKQSLHERDPQKLLPMLGHQSDIGVISRAIYQLIHQSQEIDKEIVHRLKTEEALNLQKTADELLAKISVSLINLSLEEFPVAINSVIREAGMYAGAERCKIFLTDISNSSITSLEFEWCAEGVPGSLGMTPRVFMEEQSWLMAEFMKGELIFVDDIEQWRNLGPDIKSSFHEQKVKSLALIPLIYKDEFYGFISFQYLKNGNISEFKKIEALRNIGDIFINASVSYNQNLRLKQYSQKLETMLQETSNDLADTESLYRTIFNNINDGIVLSDINGGIIDSNEIFRKYLGFSKQELKLMDTKTLLSPLPGFNAGNIIDQIVSEGTALFEISIIDKNDEIKLAEVNSRLIPYKNIQAILSVFRDITERKKAEDEKRLLWESVINSPTGIVITDKKGYIQFINKAYLEITGYNPDEVIGNPVVMFRSGMMPDTFFDDFYQDINQGKSWTGRLINKKKDNTLFDEEMTIFCIKNNEGEITNFVAIKRDITEQIRLENEIKRSERLQSIGTLASFIAHDFNSILQIIQIYSDLISIENDVPSEVKNYLEPINTSIQRGKELIQSILTYNRQVDDNLKPQHFKVVIEEALVFLKALVPSGVTVITEINDVGKVNCNTGKIHQMLMNLLSNSLDAFTHDGTINIELQEINNPSINHEIHEGKWCFLAFTDNGSGMDEYTLKNIYNPFYTTKESGMGTGIGVPKILNIMQFHQGHIVIESELGKGTCFKLFFSCVS